ncbi:hypothetical protein GF323_01250 [Candidatus Woesearchaeota archaeon]|nr:hypothetical protein [Candidatus Woesearchaeota archaeon]
MIVLTSSLFFYRAIQRKAGGITQKQICESSVSNHAAMHIGDISVDSPLKCSTQYVTVESGEKQEVMHELAMRMYDCWDMFGQGKLNLFPQKESTTINYCVICHHIQFKEKLQISAEEFIEYLKTHEIPTGKKTFQQYLSNTIKTRQTKDVILEKGETDLSKIDIDTSIPYATMFTYNKEGYWHKISTTLIGIGAGIPIGIIGIILVPVSSGASLIAASAIIGGTSGAIIGYNVGSPIASGWNASVQLLPYELSQLNTLQCDYLPVTQGGQDE